MKKKSFWLTNTSKRNVSLADLGLTVKAMSSVNLLDNRHYYYTLEQLQKSAATGSIFNKRKILFVRIVEPNIIKMNVPLIKETYLSSRQKSLYEIKEDNYEELNVSDEEFAAENADLTE